MTSHSRRANWLTVYIFSNLGFATSRPTCARSANPNVSDATPPKAQLREPQAQRIICAFSMISAYLRAVWKSYTGTHAPRRLISATMLARGADGLAGARGCGALLITYKLAIFSAPTRRPRFGTRFGFATKAGPAWRSDDILVYSGFGFTLMSCPKAQIGASPRAERAKQRCRARHVPSDKPSRVRLGRSIAGVTGAVPRDARIDRGSGHRERRDGFRLRLQVERRMLRDAATHGAPRARRARRRAGAARGAEIPRHAEGASPLPFRSPDRRRPRSRHGDARDRRPVTTMFVRLGRSTCDSATWTDGRSTK